MKTITVKDTEVIVLRNFNYGEFDIIKTGWLIGSSLPDLLIGKKERRKAESNYPRKPRFLFPAFPIHEMKPFSVSLTSRLICCEKAMVLALSANHTLSQSATHVIKSQTGFNRKGRREERLTTGL
jgi:hypothetical protein